MEEQKKNDINLAETLMETESNISLQPASYLEAEP